MTKELYANKKQLEFLQAQQRLKIWIGGRGSGKSTLIGISQRQKMAAMPRAKMFFASTTYNQILTKTMPAIRSIWEDMGLKKATATQKGHYVIGQKPPKYFQSAYAEPEEYKNVISFINGYRIEFISMDRPDLNRGGSYDGGEIDEAALLKREVVTKVLLPSVRGNRFKFNTPLHYQVGMYSSIPWKPSGYWLFDYEEKAKEKPDKYYLIESTTYDNIEVLGKDYIEILKDELSYLEFEVEVNNRRFTRLPDGFYPAFSDRHTYTPHYKYGEGAEGITVEGLKDVDANAILEVSFDFSGWFNCCTVWQERNGVERCVRNLFVKEDDKLNALVKKFVNTYADHRVKFVRVWGEPRGHDRQPMTPSIYETVQALFESHGWRCEIAVQPGRANNHLERHQFMDSVFLEDNPMLPKVQINEDTCKELIIAIQVTQITPDYSKNKSKEKDRNFPQEHAPHLTDTMDYYLVQKHFWKVFNEVNHRAGEAIFL